MFLYKKRNPSLLIVLFLFVFSFFGGVGRVQASLTTISLNCSTPPSCSSVAAFPFNITINDSYAVGETPIVSYGIDGDEGIKPSAGNTCLTGKAKLVPFILGDDPVNAFSTCLDRDMLVATHPTYTQATTAAVTATTTGISVFVGASGYTSQTVIIPITVVPAVINGCTDSNANNYNSAATIDNGTCTYSAPTANLTVTPNAVPLNGNVDVALTSTNTNYCHVYKNSGEWNANPVLPVGHEGGIGYGRPNVALTFNSGALTAPGIYAAAAYCWGFGTYAGGQWYPSVFFTVCNSGETVVGGVCAPPSIKLFFTAP